MADLVLSILSSAGVAAVLLSAVAFLAKNAITERLRHAVAAEYNEKIERLKAEQQSQLELLRAELSRRGEVQKAATASWTAAYAAAHERRLCAVERLWLSVVRIRAQTPALLDWVDAVLPEELETVSHSYPHIYQAIVEFDDDAFRTRVYEAAGDIESQRPFAAYAVALVSAYREYPLLTARLLRQTTLSAETRPWYADQRLKHFLLALLSPDRYREITACDLGKFRSIQNALERKILEVLAPIVSGEESAAEGLHRAASIANAVALVSRGA